MKKIAINGFGRIGRLVFRILQDKPDVQVVAVNDLTDVRSLAHLLKYDTAQGTFAHTVSHNKEGLLIDNRMIPVYQQENPADLPWGELDVDLVLECTGVFRTEEQLRLHRQAGAKKVLLSAPAKGGNVPTFVLGVNDGQLSDDMDVLSNASCTTNCLAPVVKVLNEQFGLEKGFVTTTHAYTANQRLQDAPHRDLRRARAAAQNIVPTSTGAAKAVGLVYPPLAGKLNAIAMRVPVITGSLVDINAQVSRSCSAEEINEAFQAAANGPLKGLLLYTEDPIVSSDIIGSPYSSIVDGLLTDAKDNLIKVIAWYDNEFGYAARLADLALRV